MKAIEVEGLTKRFGDVLAVDRIGFTVDKGSMTALLGSNGAGKTTTLAMLLGLLVPTEGSIRVLGVDMVRHRFKVLSRMNFSSPYVDMPRRLKVLENLIVYGLLYCLDHVQRRIHELGGALDIRDLLHRPYGTLSAGQKTRVAIVKALLNDPEVLLLDEPTASLDPDNADRIRRFLKDYQRRHGTTIVLASHNMAEVERLCDDVIMMRAGRIVDRGTPRQLIERYGRKTLEEVFLDIARAP